jgi:hypothetical protein
MHDPMKVAERFAQALDREDYAAAASCLASACEYSIRGRVHRGVEAILAAYREAGSWAASELDGVRFESSVRLVRGGGAVVTFVDHLERAGEQVTHRCEQRLAFDEAGKICRIEHVDLPGEREALAAFFARVGIVRGEAADEG